MAVEAAAVVLGILELVVVVELVLVLEEVHLHQPLIQILVDKVATMVVMEAAATVEVAETRRVRRAIPRGASSSAISCPTSRHPT